MRVIITYLDGTTLELDYVEELALDGPHRLRTKTFGNHFVIQKNVESFEASFSFQKVK